MVTFSGVILSILAAVSAGFFVPVGIMIVDAYPTQYRLSGTAIGYNALVLYCNIISA